ncbi:MAG: metallophosphoesterase family protein [Myxococcales bacterium]|nr:metallophosphoesterase family protein [Myxococcales bacterium]
MHGEEREERRCDVVIAPDVRLPSTSRLLILSDLHIADLGPGDLFAGRDEVFLAMLARETADIDAVVLNGDVLDHLHVADNARIERAHPRTVAALRELSQRLPVIMLIGNHDNEALARQAFPEMAFHHALAVGDVLITHGHQFDLHWNGDKQSHFAARFHAALEHYLRLPIRLPFRDYVNIPNGVIHRLFFRYTQALRLYGSVKRAVGDPAPYERWQRIDRFWSRGQWGDLGNIYDEALVYLESTGARWRTLVVGHSHQPGVVPRHSGHTYVNSGSWCLGDASFVRLRDGEARVFDALSGEEYGDERYRALHAAVELPDMAGWFRRYYRGFFRYDLAAIERDFPSDIPERGFTGVRGKARPAGDKPGDEQHGRQHQLAG